MPVNLGANRFSPSQTKNHLYANSKNHPGCPAPGRHPGADHSRSPCPNSHQCRCGGHPQPRWFVGGWSSRRLRQYRRLGRQRSGQHHQDTRRQFILGRHSSFESWRPHRRRRRRQHADSGHFGSRPESSHEQPHVGQLDGFGGQPNLAGDQWPHPDHRRGGFRFQSADPEQRREQRRFDPLKHCQHLHGRHADQQRLGAAR